MVSRRRIFIRYLFMTLSGLIFSFSAQAVNEGKRAGLVYSLACKDLQEMGILEEARSKNYSMSDLPFINKSVVMRCWAELSKSATDLYVVYVDDAPIQSIVKVAENDSWKDCQEMAKRRLKSNMRCTWGDETIFERVVKDPSPRQGMVLSENGKKDQVNCRDMKDFGIIERALEGQSSDLLGGFGKYHALRCLAILSGLPTDLYVVELDGETRFATPFASESDALADCRRAAQKHVARSVRCTWGGKVLFEIGRKDLGECIAQDSIRGGSQKKSTRENCRKGCNDFLTAADRSAIVSDCRFISGREEMVLVPGRGSDPRLEKGLCTLGARSKNLQYFENITGGECEKRCENLILSLGGLAPVSTCHFRTPRNGYDFLELMEERVGRGEAVRLGRPKS